MLYLKPKIINNKRYNVNAAELIGEKDGLALYRKTTGEYFATENNEYVILKEKEQVKQIAKKVLTDRQFDYQFNIQESDITRYMINLPQPIHEAVSKKAKETDSTIRDIIVELLYDALF